MNGIDKQTLLKLCEEARNQAESDQNSNYYDNLYCLAENFIKENAEEIEVKHAPDYSLLISKDLVDAVPLSPPDGRYLFYRDFEFDIDKKD